MRIVAGTHRGRVIAAPDSGATRPTADRTRQALFNVLEHARWAPNLIGAAVLDLFAGSGALGLESLSRGAASALFVENNPRAIETITANIARLTMQGQADARLLDVRQLGSRAAQSAPFNLVFLDPPYGLGLAEVALNALVSGGWLADEALVVVERGVGEPALRADGFESVDTRNWGAARITFLRPAGPRN